MSKLIENTETKEWTLEAECELRLEVKFGERIKLKLKSGTAEIFGAELAVGPEYVFSGTKIALFTWHGCNLQITGNCSVAYQANETPMISYLNTHMALEQRREDAKEKGEEGPKVLVLGPTDVGKTSLCKLLMCYGVRMGRRPIYVNLDSDEGTITMPGTLSATALSHIVEVDEAFGLGAVPTTGSSVSPLSYYYGYTSISDNEKLYKLLVSRLSHAVKCRMADDEDARVSGLIIDTCGFIDQSAYSVLDHIIQSFMVTTLLVLGHERLYSDMLNIYKDNSTLQVVKLAKSGGVVQREPAFLRQAKMAKIKEYFYGTPKSELSPYSVILHFSDVVIYRVGGGSLAPSSALPLGSDRTVSETQLMPVDPGDILLHSVLALSNATSEEEVLEANVAGFVYVSEVNEAKRKMTVLSPSPGRLPKKYLIMGSFKWVES
ncbi:uncharacterized protein VTP21DRAFT_1435 [Calcarisporiella thermophila]|uniref:uncharacterized protein n=1 Tax=Calcarisporiella thermophila TaxID=911321 RepID=UPI0037429AE0